MHVHTYLHTQYNTYICVYIRAYKYLKNAPRIWEAGVCVYFFAHMRVHAHAHICIDDVHALYTKTEFMWNVLCVDPCSPDIVLCMLTNSLHVAVMWIFLHEDETNTCTYTLRKYTCMLVLACAMPWIHVDPNHRIIMYHKHGKYVRVKGKDR